eukprot:Hpha_TRINITY_DN15576_c0_g2::TRINITY_DN15576_c0_g2_i2::g.108702::m.108702
MSGLIVFVSAPGRSDSVVDLDISATVGDLLRQFNEQSGLAARGILWEDRTVNDEKLALADLGICPESRVRVQLRGHCGWVQEGLQLSDEQADAVIMHVETGVVIEIGASSNGWFRWLEEDLKEGQEEGVRVTGRMAWPETSDGGRQELDIYAQAKYEALLDKRSKRELPGEHALEHIFEEESTSCGECGNCTALTGEHSFVVNATHLCESCCFPSAWLFLFRSGRRGTPSARVRLGLRPLRRRNGRS